MSIWNMFTRRADGRAEPVSDGLGVPRPIARWGVLWRSKSRLDGERQHLCCKDLNPVLFRTRAEARSFIEREYGFIRNRKDLQVEPHGWSLPVPVRVKIAMEVSA